MLRHFFWCFFGAIFLVAMSSPALAQQKKIIFAPPPQKGVIQAAFASLDLTRILPVAEMAVDPSGHVLLAGFKNSLSFFSLKDGREQVRTPLLKPLKALALADKGALGAVLHTDGETVLYAPQTGQVLKKLKGIAAGRSVALSRSGHMVATGYSNGSINLWQSAKPDTPRYLKGAPLGTQVLAFDQAEKRLAAGFGDGRIVVWSVPDGMERGTVTLQGDMPIKDLAFDGSGHMLYVLRMDGALFRWDMANVPTRMDMGGFSLNALDVGGQGYLGGASRGGGVLVSDLFAPAPPISLKGNRFVKDVHFVRRGSYALTRNGDGSIDILRRQDGRLQGRLAFASEGWIVLHDSGRFDAEKDGAAIGIFSAAEKQFDMRQFFETHFTPGLMRSLLGGAFRPPAFSLTDRFAPPPKVAFKPSSPTQTANGAVELTVQATDQGGGIKEMRLYDNGALLRTWQPTEKTRVFTKKETLTLSAGRHELTLVAVADNQVRSKPVAHIVQGR